MNAFAPRVYWENQSKQPLAADYHAKGATDEPNNHGKFFKWNDTAACLQNMQRRVVYTVWKQRPTASDDIVIRFYTRRSHTHRNCCMVRWAHLATLD